MTCYLLVRGRDWQQESYESASRDAGRRTRQLRKLGFHAQSFSLGSQVTSVGRVNMTIVDVRNIGDRDVPNPDRVIRL